MHPCLVKTSTLCKKGVSGPHSGPASLSCQEGGLLWGDHPPSAVGPTSRLLPRASVCWSWPHTWGLRGLSGLPPSALAFPVLAAPGQVAGPEPHTSGAHAGLVLPPAMRKPWGCGRCRLSKHHSPQRSTGPGSDFLCPAGYSGGPRRGGMEGGEETWATGWEKRGAGARSPRCGGAPK